jgi:hypothetical protein
MAMKAQLVKPTSPVKHQNMPSTMNSRLRCRRSCLKRAHPMMKTIQSGQVIRLIHSSPQSSDIVLQGRGESLKRVEIVCLRES